MARYDSACISNCGAHSFLRLREVGGEVVRGMQAARPSVSSMGRSGRWWSMSHATLALRIAIVLENPDRRRYLIQPSGSGEVFFAFVPQNLHTLHAV